MKNKVALMVTLGHNSSALFYDGISNPIGYEEERLNGIKSSSAFPAKAISKIITNLPTDALRGATLMISHWFNSFDMDKFPEKYFDHEYVLELITAYNMKVELLTEDFTHHDAHMMSSKAFYEYHDGKHEGPMHYIVADGFGNNQEVFSIYKEEVGAVRPIVIGQLSGYYKSLGLMYQYATSYCGMKENQDEYKFLGYEAQVFDVLSPKQIGVVDETSTAFATDFINEYVANGGQYHIIDENINLRESLIFTKDVYHTMFDQLIVSIGWGIELPNSNDMRSVIGFFIQNTIEKALVGIIKELNIENVCLSGGCFYNVKLNNAILKAVKGKVSVMPLAGDQGCGIGMYHHFIGEQFNFGDLCYGVRDMSDARYKNEEAFIDDVVRSVERGDIVNIMMGNMEFGPRALCNTSTLALPTKENVEYINTMNKRNTVMPMAPVILDHNVSALFEDTDSVDRVVGSNQYMIMTHDLRAEVVGGNYDGIMHKYPDGSGFSGRPQIVQSGSGSTIEKILQRTKALALINTSFNTHGTPILYSLEDGMRDFAKQRERDVEGRNQFFTYVGI